MILKDNHKELLCRLVCAIPVQFQWSEIQKRRTNKVILKSKVIVKDLRCTGDKCIFQYWKSFLDSFLLYEWFLKLLFQNYSSFMFFTLTPGYLEATWSFPATKSLNFETAYVKIRIHHIQSWEHTTTGPHIWTTSTLQKQNKYFYKHRH